MSLKSGNNVQERERGGGSLLDLPSEPQLPSFFLDGDSGDIGPEDAVLLEPEKEEQESKVEKEKEEEEEEEDDEKSDDSLVLLMDSRQDLMKESSKRMNCEGGRGNTLDSMRESDLESLLRSLNNKAAFSSGVGPGKSSCSSLRGSGNNNVGERRCSGGGRPATPAPWSQQNDSPHSKFSFDSGVVVNNNTTTSSACNKSYSSPTGASSSSLSLFQSLTSNNQSNNNNNNGGGGISCSPYSTGPAYSLFPKPPNATNVVNFAKSDRCGPAGDASTQPLLSSRQEQQLCQQIYNSLETNPSLFSFGGGNNSSKLDPNSKPFSPATRMMASSATQTMIPNLLQQQRQQQQQHPSTNSCNAATAAAWIHEFEKLKNNLCQAKHANADINGASQMQQQHYYYPQTSNANHQQQQQHQLLLQQQQALMKNVCPNLLSNIQSEMEMESAIPLKYRNSYYQQNNKNHYSTTATGRTPSASSAPMNSARKDDYGLRGLLNNIHESSRSANSSRSSILSQTDLGFSPEYQRNIPYLSQVMESPFSNKSLGVFSDHYIPSEYCHSGILAGRLPLPGSHYLPTDFLFFLFYLAIGDALQILAGSQLFDRGWRYNKVSQIWLARLPGVPPEERNSFYEQGIYQYFDVRTWSRTSGKFTLKYHELAEQINPPNELRGMFNTMQVMNQLQQKRKEMALAILRNNPRLISSLSSRQ